jgi:hypothetical protein
VAVVDVSVLLAALGFAVLLLTAAATWQLRRRMNAEQRRREETLAVLAGEDIPEREPLRERIAQRVMPVRWRLRESWWALRYGHGYRRGYLEGRRDMRHGRRCNTDRSTGGGQVVQLVPSGGRHRATG